MTSDTLALLFIALFNAVTTFMQWRIHNKIEIIKGDVHVAKKNIALVELATNSMKDALVSTTAKASQAIGELKGRADAQRENETK